VSQTEWSTTQAVRKGMEWAALYTLELNLDLFNSLKSREKKKFYSNWLLKRDEENCYNYIFFGAERSI